MQDPSLFSTEIANLTTPRWFTTSKAPEPERILNLFEVSFPQVEWDVDKIRHIFDNPRIRKTFLAYTHHSGQIIGHCSYKIEGHQPFAHWIAVNPQYRGLGIGSTLLKNVAICARRDGHNRLLAYFNYISPELEAFCKSSGFRKLSGTEAQKYRERRKELYQ
jgi:GNAT superfamily N-acetyltransferase